jgi:hypothetical protein
VSGGRQDAIVRRITLALRVLWRRSPSALDRWQRWTHRRRILVSGTAVFSLALTGLVAVPALAAVDPCVAPVSVIACENSKTGTPADVWEVWGAGDDTIQGFATDMSVNAGETIGFKVKTPAAAYTIDIYRLGWYGGAGARKIASATPSAPLPQNQPACVTDPSTELYDCGTWGLSASWAVPASAVSGVYVAKLRRTDTGGASQASHITFVVRQDSSRSDLFMQTSDATWHAYNKYGGSNFYAGGANGRAYKLSYNRPFATRGGIAARDFLYSNEYPMIRFLERNGYDVSYTTNVDSDRRGALIRNHKAFLSVGHDEYWSKQQRANVEAARDAGTHLAFFSGNEVYWKTRLEASADGSNTPGRTIVCYKETWANAKMEPGNDWTGTWRDPRFSPPADGGRPENALTGTMFMSNSVDLAIQVLAGQGKYRLWRNTSVASLAAGATATLAPHTVGYESDEDIDNGFRPNGLIQLSTTTGSTPEYLRDYGNTVTPGVTTHHLTLYRAASGALVFSAGTVQWAWGLDSEHDGPQAPADSRMQQATVNLFADMNVQPWTLMSGLVPATASTDLVAPTTTVTSPANGTTIKNGSMVTLQGTATDGGGGQVAGVEVSTDGGTSWHPATGTSTWSYPFVASGMSTMAVLVRAIDDSANKGANPTTVQYPLTGPHSLFGETVPTSGPSTEAGALELGVKVKPSVDGFVTGVRFYKDSGNTGSHTGTLWSSSGTRLATGTFTGETTTGWQTLMFGTSVAVKAGSTYVVSYFAPNGRYTSDSYAFLKDHVAGPLTAPMSSSVGGNGVWKYGSGFPTETWNATNYFVDLLFLDAATAPPTVVSTTPLDKATGVPITLNPAAVFSKDIVANSVTFTLKDPANATVAGTAAYNAANKMVTFTQSAPLASAVRYTATVHGLDAKGQPADLTWSFTTDLSPDLVRLFASDAVPATPSAVDGAAVTLGVRFTSSVNGSIVGIRYYQGPGNTGTHTGSIWTSGGVLLAKTTFTSENGSGWQTAAFSTSVPVTAGTEYVASYYAPNGNYAANGSFFTSPYTNGPLSAPSGKNGVYRYGGDLFPTDTYNSTNYWVDPLLLPSSGPTPTPTPSATPPPPPPSSTVNIFGPSELPAVSNYGDNAAIEVGVRFTSDVAGTVIGVRFYKGPTNIGTHTGSVWSASGQLLATATFASETGSGWQTVQFSQPVQVVPGTTYVASYHSTVGYYAVTVNQFASTGVDRVPLHVPVNGGAYFYGPGSFPWNASSHNFWVDVLFVPS